MEHNHLETDVARKSALIYLPIAFGVALLFLLAASLLGEYPTVAKIGGAVWIALLSLIVSMPIVTSRVKKRLRGRPSTYPGNAH
jgi:hypothetical protein